MFALVRLGITDSAQIADFLRYSITTIYNYRSKFRKKSIVPNGKFEERIMKIGAESG
jgi:DNA-binding CsgD family transcriptional regulator